MSRRIALMPDGSSWVEYHPNVLKLTHEEYADLWNLHPTERSIIRVYGKSHEMRRWNQSYGRSYAFSGQVAQAAPETPELVQRCIDLVNARETKEDSKEEEETTMTKKRARTEKPVYNMALVNWYRDGNDVIRAHSDDERELVPGEPIACFSFGATRKFHLRPKKTTQGGISADLLLEDGSLVIMGGDCQRTHTHSIPEAKRVRETRVSVTVRKFI